MFVKIPFESEIPFKTNISEITKMSLEHDFNINDGVVLGNFYISGEYRSHEISVNTDPFNFTLPFSVDYSENLLRESLEFNIEDFSYDIINDNTLKVNIEYSLTGEVREEDIFERVNEEELESELSYIDDLLEDKEENDTVIEEVDKSEEFDKKIEEVEELKEEEDRLTDKEEKTIMETIKNSDDTFVTYHIHIVKESETVESISNVYGVPSSLINEYNETDTINVGDKILIPKIDE